MPNARVFILKSSSNSKFNEAILCTLNLPMGVIFYAVYSKKNVLLTSGVCWHLMFTFIFGYFDCTEVTNDVNYVHIIKATRSQATRRLKDQVILLI